MFLSHMAHTILIDYMLWINENYLNGTSSIRNSLGEKGPVDTVLMSGGELRSFVLAAGLAVFSPTLMKPYPRFRSNHFTTQLIGLQSVCS